MIRLPLILISLLAALLLPGWATAALNDTGITQCATDTQNNLPCPQAGFPSQDAETGRDAQQTAGTLTKVGGGSAGFDFTKLDSGGTRYPTAIKLSPVAPISVTPTTLGVTDEPGYVHDRNHPSSAHRRGI